MIRDLSETLRKILTQPGLPEPLRSALIVFDRPAEPYNPGQTTVNLYLYDIRENTELRSNEPVIERLNGQAIVHPPPLRVACSYLVTAWPVGGAEPALQEQQLLSQALQLLSRYPTIPKEFLQGSLKGQEPSLPMVTAQADGLKNPAEFWTALGNRLRPSFTATASIAMEVVEPLPPAPVVITEHVRIDGEQFFRIGGVVTDANGQPIPQAKVTLVELGFTAATNADGQYTISMIPSAGEYTVRARSDDAVKEVRVTVPAPAGKDYNVRLT